MNDRPTIRQETPLWQEVSAGVIRISLPVPFVGLRQVNLWLLRDDCGWLMIDCGWGDDATRARLRQVWDEALDGLPVTRLLVTHFHPDHMGNCRWICETWGITPLTSTREWAAAKKSRALGLLDNVPNQAAFFRRHGLGEAELTRYESDFLTYDKGVELAPHFTLLADGDRLEIGPSTWQVLTGAGHSPEMIMLHAPDRGLFISGDQLLAGISSNVSVGHFEPDADPLADYLDSLERLERVLAPETLVLASHRAPFTGGPARAAALRQHHAERLEKVERAILQEGEMTAAALLPVLFGSRLDGTQIGFAMGEAIAHLNHLFVRGRLRRIDTGPGPIRFRSIHKSAS